MKGLKKLALASAVLAASTGAFAMEALQDDQLSATTGQAGLSILQTNVSVTAAALRYSDSDGFTGAAAGLNITDATDVIPPVGACGNKTPVACVGQFTYGGSLNLSGFGISATSILTTVDVGSTGTGSSDVTGLLIGSKINNLNVSLGGISFDNGNQLSGAGALLGAQITGERDATNAPTYTGGYLTAGSDIGGVALTGINLPNASAFLITAGTAHFGKSGLTITSLIPIAQLGLTVNYYNTTLQNYTAGTGFTANAGATTGSGAGGIATATDGLISLPINLYGILTGPTEIAAGNTSGGYGIAAGQGLEIATNGTGIAAIDIGGTGGMQIAGSNAGSVGIIGLTVGASQIYVSGH